MNKLFFISAFLITILFGCRQQQDISKRYYVIEIPAEQNIALKDTLVGINKYCEVKMVEISPPFATQRIAVRGSSHEIEYFRNHEWATRPAENFAAIITEFFDRYKVFKGASRRYWRIVPDYVFETTIYQLEIVENKKDLSARLNVEFRLLDKQTNEVIIKHSVDRRMQLEENKINYFAAAVSEIFYQELINMTEKIAVTIAEQ